MRKESCRFLAILMIVVMMFSALPVSADIIVNFDDDDAVVSDKDVVIDNTTPQKQKAVVPEPFTSKKYPYSTIKSRIKNYQESNTDVIGWLTVPNTNINHPILFSSASNDYYVSRDWKGQYYANINWQNYVDTATYLDFRTRLGSGWRNGTSRNLVLYGHNWSNLREPFAIGNVAGHSMFAQLPSYTDIDFAKANPHIYFSTDQSEGIWRVFAVAYGELSGDFFYNNPNPSNAKFEYLLNEWQERSILNFDVDVDVNDRILTLSTCTRNIADVGGLQRYVVVARLLRDGETEDDAVNITVNSNPKMPNFNK